MSPFIIIIFFFFTNENLNCYESAVDEKEKILISTNRSSLFKNFIFLDRHERIFLQT